MQHKKLQKKCLRLYVKKDRHKEHEVENGSDENGSDENGNEKGG